jgi:hypothetical protein
MEEYQHGKREHGFSKTGSKITPAQLNPGNSGGQRRHVTYNTISQIHYNFQESWKLVEAGNNRLYIPSVLQEVREYRVDCEVEENYEENIVESPELLHLEHVC